MSKKQRIPLVDRVSRAADEALAGHDYVSPIDTGNEGASFERTYRRAALVLWLHDRLLAVINQAGLRVTLPYLTDLVERWSANGEDHQSSSEDSTLWRQAHDLSAHMVAAWPTEYWHPRRDNDPTSTGQLLTLLTRLKDVANLELFLATVADRSGFDLGDTAAIVDAVQLLAPERAACVTTRLVTASVELTLAACGRLLTLAAPLGNAVVIGAANALVAALPDGSPRDTWRRGPGVGPGFVVDLFTALARIDTALADHAASHLLAWPSTYGFDTILVSAVRDLLASHETAGVAAVQRLRLACVGHLDARVAEPLEAPRDWQRASAVGCKCAYCAELSGFLADPQTSRRVLRANEGDRSHVESTIRTARCDVDTLTERRGRPYSLICTKNQASYDRLRTQRQRDLADLARLNGCRGGSAVPVGARANLSRFAHRSKPKRACTLGIPTLRSVSLPAQACLGRLGVQFLNPRSVHHAGPCEGSAVAPRNAIKGGRRRQARCHRRTCTVTTHGSPLPPLTAA
jgi:hypothetical protein